MDTVYIGSATVDRRRRIDDLYAKCAFGSGVMLVVAEAIYFALWRQPAFFRPTWDVMGGPIGRDFVNVWMGARSAFAGGPAGWFDPGTYNAAVHAMLPPRGSVYPVFWSYPPHLLLFTWPFGLMPYLAAYAVWCIGGLAAFAVAVRAGGIQARNLPFVVLAPATAINVFSGQNGFLIPALLIGGLSVLDRRPILAGVLFGILTVKPQLGLLLPVMLVLTGRWRTIAAAAATTAALVAVTAALYGPHIWMEYLAKIGPQQVYLLQTVGFHMMPTAFAGMRLMGLPADGAWAVQAVQSAAALAATVWTFSRRRDGTLSVALLVTATFLFTPYSYNYDLTAIAYVAGTLRQRDDNTALDHCLILAAWGLPVAMVIVHLVLPQLPVACFVLPPLGARLLWRLGARPQAATPDRLSMRTNGRLNRNAPATLC
jgi:alpha-1,2-mannosyltransferase